MVTNTSMNNYLLIVCTLYLQHIYYSTIKMQITKPNQLSN